MKIYKIYFKKIKSLLCKFYGLKSSTLVNEVRKCIFLSKFEKPKRSLDHLKLHINRENYLTIIFKCANTLQMNLDSTLERGRDENLKLLGSDIVFSYDISEMLFDMIWNKLSNHVNDIESDNKIKNSYLIQVILKKVF